MERVIIVKSGSFIRSLTTKIRSKETGTSELQELLFDVGRFMGQEIIGKEFTEVNNVITPMNLEFKGLGVNYKNVMILGTKDDFEFFLKGIGSVFQNVHLNYLDFKGQRGVEAYTADIGSMVLDDVHKGTYFDAIIIAKSILATGCTAVSLAKEALSQIMPTKLIIASCFYSSRGIDEIHTELPQAKLYLLDEPDMLDANDMLVPGVGNIDERLKLK